MKTNPQVLLSQEIHRKLKVFAALSGREMREVASTAIDEYIERNSQPQPIAKAS
ncbi:MAG: hypothetical protein SFY66_19595 [Oculatellaceae cyanobacterium bins.114]|nr:hypothetical protein [Oculatellaceae cyanobacterium bins.114]